MQPIEFSSLLLMEVYTQPWPLFDSYSNRPCNGTQSGHARWLRTLSTLLAPRYMGLMVSSKKKSTQTKFFFLKKKENVAL